MTIFENLAYFSRALYSRGSRFWMGKTTDLYKILKLALYLFNNRMWDVDMEEAIKVDCGASDEATEGISTGSRGEVQKPEGRR